MGVHYYFRSDGNLWPLMDMLFSEAACPGYGETDRDAQMTVAAVRERYARSYDNVAADLAALEDLRVLDFNGHQIMTNFALSELGEPVKFES